MAVVLHWQEGFEIRNNAHLPLKIAPQSVLCARNETRTVSWLPLTRELSA